MDIRVCQRKVDLANVKPLGTAFVSELKHRGFNVESLNEHCVPAGACLKDIFQEIQF